MAYLRNLPGLWRVSCRTQGLGTYLPINLGLNAHTPNFWLRNQRFMVYLPNLPGFWRVSCWTQGLGTYLLINLDLNAHTQNFSLRTQWFMVYLPNLPGLWRVSCWTQGLGTYLPINLDLNAHIPKFWLRNSRIGWFTESTRILQGILLDPGIRYISTDLPWFKRTYPKFLT